MARSIITTQIPLANYQHCRLQNKIFPIKERIIISLPE